MKILLENIKEERLFRTPKISTDDLKLKFEEYHFTEDLEILVLSNLDDVRATYKDEFSKPVMDNELNCEYDNLNKKYKSLCVCNGLLLIVCLILASVIFL